MSENPKEVIASPASPSGESPAAASPRPPDTNSAFDAGENAPDHFLWPMKVVWPVACFITLVFGYFLTPEEALLSLAQSQGSIEEWHEHMAFAAGYTLPATVSFFVGFLFIRRGPAQEYFRNTALILLAIFLASALICRALGLGLPVYVEEATFPNTHPLAALAAFILGAYLNSYGMGLFITAAALGTAAAMQVDNWFSEHHIAY